MIKFNLSNLNQVLFNFFVWQYMCELILFQYYKKGAQKTWKLLQVQHVIVQASMLL